ncbi:hypothetical protein L1987_68039 [Smallanthus sonchifolius]|uniref:Uncharacterized protein n=1 Tax=Smallanthus sonchifolius TaxID=185202 RepID=A0ACB9B432_9ASTR|nr:hypothetical protein L1987_68039 [Smallanthus sonchifolius]
MKSRPRRMILYSLPRSLGVIDDNVPVEDKVHVVIRLPSPLDHQQGTKVSIAGTHNGIVLLALSEESKRYKLILYNPLTCASKIVFEGVPYDIPYVFGFGIFEDKTTQTLWITGRTLCWITRRMPLHD